MTINTCPLEVATDFVEVSARIYLRKQTNIHFNLDISRYSCLYSGSPIMCHSKKHVPDLNSHIEGCTGCGCHALCTWMISRNWGHAITVSHDRSWHFRLSTASSLTKSGHCKLLTLRMKWIARLVNAKISKDRHPAFSFIAFLQL